MAYLTRRRPHYRNAILVEVPTRVVEAVSNVLNIPTATLSAVELKHFIGL
jgi:hypothetical protein